jgi:hypothetical protein
MSMSGNGRRLPITAAAYDRGAERLLVAVGTACDPRLGFAEQVESALRATLDLFTAEPELARALTMPALGAGESVARRRQHWLGRYGDLLHRAAAAEFGRRRDPHFLKPLLIGGAFSLISCEVVAGRTEQLPQLLPTLLEFLLVYYLAPREAGARARAAGLGYSR